MNIHILIDQQQLGPYSETEVRQRLATGKFSQDALAWAEGMPEWIPIADLIQDGSGHEKPPVAPTVPATVEHSPEVSTLTSINQVPWYRRSTPNSLAVFFGFFFFPPLLWATCVVVLTGEIYSSQKQPDGSLKKWSKGNRTAAIIVLILQCSFLLLRMR